MSKDNAINLPVLRCTRCGHQWHPRRTVRPAHCAACNSPYWDRPRQSKAGKATKTTTTQEA